VVSGQLSVVSCQKEENFSPTPPTPPTSPTSPTSPTFLYERVRNGE
jgi:hypothetical protein